MLSLILSLIKGLISTTVLVLGGLCLTQEEILSVAKVVKIVSESVPF